MDGPLSLTDNTLYHHPPVPDGRGARLFLQHVDRRIGSTEIGNYPKLDTRILPWLFQVRTGDYQSLLLVPVHVCSSRFRYRYSQGCSFLSSICRCLYFLIESRDIAHLFLAAEAFEVTSSTTHIDELSGIRGLLR